MSEPLRTRAKTLQSFVCMVERKCLNFRTIGKPPLLQCPEEIGSPVNLDER